MKKTFLVTLGIILAVVVSLSFTRDDPKYKNLKILPKDISEHDLDSIMHHFNASLGVKCGFCHMRNETERKMDYASDIKTDKLEARKMMIMANAINDKYFKEEAQDNSKQNIPAVTCYTCHHGEQMPVGIPIPRSALPDRSYLYKPADSTKK